MRAWTSTAMVLACAALGCGGDGGGGGGSGGAAGTGIAGTGIAGTGIAGTGIAGTGGTAGTAAGTGGTGGGGTMKTCADYAASGAARGTHDAVALILRGDGTPTNMSGSCAFSSCHTGTTPRATLNFSADPNITTALVNVPACQAAGMVRVAPGNPAASWLWIKLTGPYSPTNGAITFAATAQNCAHTDPGTLGASMPWTGGAAPIPLGDAQLYQICTWIEDGAPGP